MKKLKIINFWLIFSVISLIYMFHYLIARFYYSEERLLTYSKTQSKVDFYELEINLAHEEVLQISDFIESAPQSERNLYNYNKNLSDSIGALRELPDTRDASCSKFSYNTSLAHTKSQVSVIIAFHNEARSTLLRTLLSIIARTPAQFLKEIILLDDCSEDADLLSKLRSLDAITGGTHLIKMHRNTRRLGVIASRNLGAKLAGGHYLFFVDSHCEVNVGWLEPLLDRIIFTRDDSVAVSPVVDSIDALTFKYRATLKYLKGGFDWNLHFHWMRATERSTREMNDMSRAFRTPAFAGGIFMISRNWFFKLNGFNPLLEVWGSESIEMSIKVWLCGGQIEIVPCSRVGHVFRKQHPFDFPHGEDGQTTYLRNSKVIAELWLNDYKYFFYASKPAAKNISLSLSIRELNKLKPDLQCRPFAWYLRNVFKELKLPNDDYIAYGKLSTDERCLQIHNQNDVGIQQLSNTPLHISLRMASCYDGDVTQWHLDRHSGQLSSNSGACLNVLAEEEDYSDLSSFLHSSVAQSLRYPNVSLQYCRNSVDTQRWLRKGGRLVHAGTRLCLDNPLNDEVAVSRCSHLAPSQLFRFSIEMEKL